MRITTRLHLMFIAAALLPVAAYLLCRTLLGLAEAASLLCAAAAAAGAAGGGAWLISARLIGPLERSSASVKKFIAADYRLEAAIPKSGWPEAVSLTSALNRLMLELSAYRAFQLNQVVEERSKAKALIETITDGVLLTDDRGGLIYSNRTALELLGIPKLTPELALPGSVAREAFSAPVKAIMESEEKFMKVDLEADFSSDNFTIRKNFRILSNQFRLATLKRPGRVFVIRDITAEKEIEKAKESFFHMITHDMRSPLSSIQGYAQMLGTIIPQDPEPQKFLKRIIGAAGRLNGMINDILNTIKLERGTMKLQLAPLDAGALCARLVEDNDPMAATKRISLSAIPPAQTLELQADPALLERVLSNLVGNSLKFTPPGGSIKIAVSADKDKVRFQVDDTGPGVPDSEKTKIFEKYSQREEHKAMGFGLGLTMCKMAVELHGGRIWVESEEGKGSRFIFTVPHKAA